MPENKTIAAIKSELRTANTQFKPFNSPHEGYAVILEELDEMWIEIKNNNLAFAKVEAIQVAAMAIKFCEL